MPKRLTEEQQGRVVNAIAEMFAAAGIGGHTQIDDSGPDRIIRLYPSGEGPPIEVGLVGIIVPETFDEHMKSHIHDAVTPILEEADEQ